MIFGFDEFDPLMIIVDEEIEEIHDDMEEERSTRQYERRANQHRKLGKKEKQEQKMGNLVKYGGFNLDELDKQDSQVAATTVVGADFMKLVPGNNKVRFIPPDVEGSPFVIVNEHFIDTTTGQRVRFTCPRLMEKKPCPACAEADRLKRTGNPIDRDKAWGFYPKLRVYANVIDRENPGTPRILAFGKTIWDGLKRIRRDKDEGGDFTNPNADGFDVIITREGSGKNDTRYSVRPARTDTALAPSENEVEGIVSDQWDLTKYSSVPSLDEVISMMQNGYEKREDSPRKQIAAPSVKGRGKAADQVYDVDTDEVPW
jgi:hypothetical protein